MRGEVDYRGVVAFLAHDNAQCYECEGDDAK